ncbi:outer membrane protein assembly factor BamD [Desulfobacterales bacterium HSG16]|nr:outer membrane protein assembly factor BamD [Desulfobacterales bacterium HSG16]
MKMKHINASIVLFFLLSCYGCAFFKTETEKTAEQLAEEGMKYFEKENYHKAIESFVKLKDRYPYKIELVTLAELKTADSYFFLEEYGESASEYESFKSSHPRNEAIPYVINQIALCFFNQIDTVDRDQTPTHQALNTFKRLIKQYPDDPASVKAEDYIKQCNQSLIGHELYVANFYFKSKHYKTALNRFKNVLSFPDIDGSHENARKFITICEAKIPK